MELRFPLCVVFLMTVHHALTGPMPQSNMTQSNSTQSYDTNVQRNISLTERSFNFNGLRQRLNSNSNQKPSTPPVDMLPDCGETFCTEDPNYPIKAISSLNLNKFVHLFGDDYEEKTSVRFDDNGSGLCQSRRRLIHPKKGQTVDNTWLTIINDDNRYRQGVLIEECLNAHLPCEYHQNFPLGVESMCKQMYVYRNLLAINKEGKPVMEHFQFPSCCKCIVTSGRSSRNNPMTRVDDDNHKDKLIFSNH